MAKDKVFELTIGQGDLNDSVGFSAYAVEIDNNTSQYLQEASSGRFISPYRPLQVISLNGTNQASVKVAAPPGVPQAPIINGQKAFIRFLASEPDYLAAVMSSIQGGFSGVDSNALDITSVGLAKLAGAVGLLCDAGHQHDINVGAIGAATAGAQTGTESAQHIHSPTGDTVPTTDVTGPAGGGGGSLNNDGAHTHNQGGFLDQTSGALFLAGAVLGTLTTNDHAHSYRDSDTTQGPGFPITGGVSATHNHAGHSHSHNHAAHHHTTPVESATHTHTEA